MYIKYSSSGLETSRRGWQAKRVDNVAAPAAYINPPGGQAWVFAAASQSERIGPATKRKATGMVWGGSCI